MPDQPAHRFMWIRPDEAAKFHTPVAVLDEVTAQRLSRAGWGREQVMHNLDDGWLVCECNVLSEHPPRYEVLRAWRK
jgi:hypothetical protein